MSFVLWKQDDAFKGKTKKCWCEFALVRLYTGRPAVRGCRRPQAYATKGEAAIEAELALEQLKCFLAHAPVNPGRAGRRKSNLKKINYAVLLLVASCS